MSDRGYVIKDQNAIHFVTFSVVQWIDVFSRKSYADILVESLKYCHANKGLKIHAWCIMSNHVHLIISATAPHELSGILRDFKKFTSGQILKAIAENNHESRKKWMLWIFKKAGEKNNRNNDSQFWQKDNHPIECDTDEILETRLQYLHENPVRANIVRNEQDYIYSSGIDYYTDEKGLIEVDLLY
jgi:putative transposase